jgi:hypothetical protein
MKKTAILLLAGLFLLVKSGSSQYVTSYPDIPRIDVHSHPHNILYHEGLGTKTSAEKPALPTSPNYQTICNYLSMSDTLRKVYKINLAMWISLGGEKGIDSVNIVSRNRMMTCISDYAPQRGLTYKPGDIKGYLKKGYVGYKMWFAPYQRRLQEGEDGIKYFDDPANEAVLEAMENAGMVGASIHIADPNGPYGNRGQWCADPVEFWRMIIGLERVLQRHPDLVIVAAHGAWLVCQDAQLDFLRYMFKTYPNFYVDLAATDQYYHLVNYENLRSLFMEYSGRIMFGTDIGRLNASDISGLAARYAKSFRILETNDTVPGGFFGDTNTKGLNLPREVLENIYYKNAMKIYPGLKERMNGLGYPGNNFTSKRQSIVK